MLMESLLLSFVVHKTFLELHSKTVAAFSWTADGSSDYNYYNQKNEKAPNN